MDYVLKRELLEYFELKENRTLQENRFFMFLRNEVEFFDVPGLCRDDVDWLGYDGANMTDSEMDKLSSNFYDNCLQEHYMGSLRLEVEKMGINKIEEE